MLLDATTIVTGGLVPACVFVNRRAAAQAMRAPVPASGEGPIAEVVALPGAFIRVGVAARPPVIGAATGSVVLANTVYRYAVHEAGVR